MFSWSLSPPGMEDYILKVLSEWPFKDNLRDVSWLSWKSLLGILFFWKQLWASSSPILWAYHMCTIFTNLTGLLSEKEMPKGCNGRAYPIPSNASINWGQRYDYWATLIPENSNLACWSKLLLGSRGTVWDSLRINKNYRNLRFLDQFALQPNFPCVILLRINHGSWNKESCVNLQQCSVSLALRSLEVV